MDDNNYLAYVSVVDYGRIILFCMEVINVEMFIDLNVVMNYVVGGVSVAVDVVSWYDEILSNFFISVFIIGGSVQSVVQVLENISGLGSLILLIVENVVYFWENLGLFIVYWVNLLSDNCIVKMGFSFDYIDVCCGKIVYNYLRIDFYNDFDIYNLWIKLIYDYDYLLVDDMGEIIEL